MCSEQANVKWKRLNVMKKAYVKWKRLNVMKSNGCRKHIMLNWKDNFFRKSRNNMMKKKRSQKIGWTTWKSLALSQ